MENRNRSASEVGSIDYGTLVFFLPHDTTKHLTWDEKVALYQKEARMTQGAFNFMLSCVWAGAFVAVVAMVTWWLCPWFC